jgi:hypothetical protein
VWEIPPEPAMIFAYPPWNQTVEDEKRKQEAGKVLQAEASIA